MYDSHFSLANIPYGIASKTPNEAPSVVTRLFDTVVFLNELAEAGLLSGLSSETVATFKQVGQLPILPPQQHTLTFFFSPRSMPSLYSAAQLISFSEKHSKTYSPTYPASRHPVSRQP